MQQQNTPFRFMSFKEFVPDPLRFWLYILFLLCFQFSNGMYFCAMSQIGGDLSLTPDDVKKFESQFGEIKIQGQGFTPPIMGPIGEA